MSEAMKTLGLMQEIVDGFFEDEESIYVIESKNLGKSMIKWESYNSRGKLENDCLRYFFEVKRDFLKKIFPDKNIFACYVSKSGFSDRKASESKITGVRKIGCFSSFLLTPEDISNTANCNEIDDKEFLWLKKLFIKDS